MKQYASPRNRARIGEKGSNSERGRLGRSEASKRAQGSKESKRLKSALGDPAP